MKPELNSARLLIREELTSPLLQKGTNSWLSREMIFTFILMGSLILASTQFLTPYMVAATISYSALLIGLFLRKNRNVHVSLMTMGIVLDLAIVLTLEANRSAINTALEFTLTPIQQLHIVTSTIATVLYFPILFLGIKRFLGKGTAETKRKHLRFGVVAFVFRTLGFILMFSLLGKNV